MFGQHEAGKAIEHRHFDMLSFAGPQLVDKRGEHGLRAIGSRNLVGDEGGQIARLWIAIDLGEEGSCSRRRLNDIVIGRQILPRAILTKAGKMRVDDIGLDRFDRIITKTKFGDRLCPNIMDKDIGGCEQLTQDRRVFRRFKVQDDRFLTPVHRQMGAAHEGRGFELAHVARGIALRAFNLDDVCTQIAEHLRCIGAEYHRC